LKYRGAGGSLDAGRFEIAQKGIGTTRGECGHRKETSGGLSTSKAARELNIPVHSVLPSGFSLVIGKLWCDQQDGSSNEPSLA
jgi:hypothetical protein